MSLTSQINHGQKMQTCIFLRQFFGFIFSFLGHDFTRLQQSVEETRFGTKKWYFEGLCPRCDFHINTDKVWNCDIMKKKEKNISIMLWDVVGVFVNR